MSSLVATGTVLLLVAACLGTGAAILRTLGILRDLALEERIGWCFTTGLFAVGWLMFFPAWAGSLSPAMMLAVTGGGAALCICFAGMDTGGRTTLADAGRTPALLWAGMIAAAAILLGVDLLEGVAPPVDADSLAYHFNLPKRHLEEGGLVFVPRALDGAPPQLLHMTYMTALGLGGERAMTLWTMTSGWFSAVLVYGIARRWLPVGWSFALGLIFLSTPAMLQTGGTGHVESRLAQFGLLGTVSCALAVTQRSPRHAALAGLCSGAYAGSKLTGLLFGAACTLVILAASAVSAGERWRRLAAFAAAGSLAAFQWYLWNWLRAGDPVFPFLYAWLGVSDPGFWNDTQNAIFQNWLLQEERVLSLTPWGFLAYPIYATFANDPATESGRTGLGLFAILALPFAIGWLIAKRRELRWSTLPVMGCVAVVSCAIWYFSGTPQRVRNYLPIYPVILIAVAVPAIYWARRAGVRGPLIAGAAFCMALQAAAQTVFGIDYAKRLIDGEDRTAFIARTISKGGIVPWLNAHLKPTDRVLVFDRQLLYLLDSRSTLMAPLFQARHNLPASKNRPAAAYRDLVAGGISHVLVPGTTERRGVLAESWTLLDIWRKSGCIEGIHRETVHRVRSRTLRWTADPSLPMYVFRLTPQRCPATSTPQD